MYLLAQLLSHAALQPFSVLCAEIVNHFFPKYVELHNYPAVSRLHLCFELAVSILLYFCYHRFKKLDFFHCTPTTHLVLFVIDIAIAEI